MESEIGCACGAGGFTVMATLLDWLEYNLELGVAVKVITWLDETVPATAEKPIEVAFTGMVTELGTVSELLVDDSENVLPPVGAAWVALMMHPLVAPDVRLVGLQERVN